jgi:hypothetical protein
MIASASLSRWPPVLLAWSFLILFWPLSDALRKWTGLNQPFFILQMIIPFFLILFLWTKKCIIFEKSIVFPCLLIALPSGFLALYNSFVNNSFILFLIWLLSLSALLGPPLLICATFSTTYVYYVPGMSTVSRLVSFVSILLLLNSILLVFQSVLGRNHFLSIGAGGIFGAQLSTNTEIEIRAPGLFTFINGSSNFSVVCVIFLFSSILTSVSSRSALFRSLALLSLPIAVIRSISRTFAATVLIVSLPWIRYLFGLTSLIVFSIFSFVCFLSYDLSFLLSEGVLSFQKRINDANGIYDGFLLRFFSTLFSDFGGSDSSLFSLLPKWLSSDPLAAVFGSGLGFSSPLYRFFSSPDTSYGFLNIDGSSVLLGEMASTTILYEIGIFGFVAYLYLIFSFFSIFFRKFFPKRSSAGSNYFVSSFFALAFSFSYIYFRPANFLFTSSLVLTPFACSLLFDRFSNVRLGFFSGFNSIKD